MLFAELTPVLVVGLVAAIAFFLFSLAIFTMFFSTWIQAYLSGVPIMILDLVGMKLRQTDVKAVVRALILAKQGGVAISCAEMERAWMQGVDLEKVVLAATKVNKDNMDLTFQALVEAELENRLAEVLDRK
ncbi:MAG: flotillin-like FloA family protein [Planctomycetota bacterium]